MRPFAGFMAFCLLGLMPDLAAAYLGPGAGLSAIGSVLSFLGVIVLLVAGFLWYPVKRLWRALRRRRADPDAMAGVDDGEP